jgi:hypothetical protein
VAAPSAQGEPKGGGIIRATEEDYLALIRAQTSPLGLREGEDREKSAWPYGNFENPHRRRSENIPSHDVG